MERSSGIIQNLFKYLKFLLLIFVILRTTNKFNIMEIKVLGTGCPKCKALEKNTIEAVQESGIEANVSKVEDIADIMSYGIMSTPALVINENVVVKGRLATKKEIVEIINNL